MGNRATRRLANQLLKENGIPFKFMKRSRGKYYNRSFQNAHARFLIKNLMVGKPGTIISECDGVNYIVQGYFGWNRNKGNYDKITDLRTFWQCQQGNWLFMLPRPMLMATETSGKNKRFICHHCYNKYAQNHVPFTREEVKNNILEILKPFIFQDMLPPWRLADTEIDEKKQELFEYLIASKDNHCCNEQGIVYDKYHDEIFS